jgi:hypothetical protein
MLDILKVNGRVNLADGRFPGFFSDGGGNPFAQLDAAQKEMAESLEKEQIRFESRGFPIIPQPYVFSKDLAAQIENDFSRLHVIVERVHDLYLTSPAVRDFMNLPPIWEEFIKLECHVRPRAYYCRYDFTLTHDGTPKVYELNSTAPAFCVYSRSFYSALKNTKTFENLKRNFPFALELFSHQHEPVFGQALFDAAPENKGGQITIGIINSKYGTMVNELAAMEQECAGEGCRVERAFVEDLRFENNRLLANGVPLDLVFLKIDCRPGADFEIPITRFRKDGEALLLAIRAGLPLVNSFSSSWLLDNKTVLALLQDDLAASVLSQEDKDLIKRIVPVTRKVSRMSPVEIEECIERKDQFVLKASLDTRGRNVTVGLDCDSGGWREKIKNARADSATNYIVQEYAPPELSGGPGEKLHTSQAYYMLKGKPVGVLTRVSPFCVTNVGKGGAIQVPLIAMVA